VAESGVVVAERGVLAVEPLDSRPERAAFRY
jgi:hypothetical protein